MTFLALRLVLSLLLVLHTGLAAANDSHATQCVADLDDLARFMQANDAGTSAHLATHGPAIRTAFDTARRGASGVRDLAACDGVLQAYLLAWRRTHLQLIPAAGTQAGDSAPAPEGPDPRAPRYQALGDRTALLVLPSFQPQYAPAIARLLTEHRAALQARKHWIIDVRTNDGGSDASFAPLLGWLLDGHLYRHGVEYFVTPANIQAQHDVCTLMFSDPAPCLQQVAPNVARMRAAPAGDFVPVGQARSGSIQVEVEEGRPERVAILTDRACGSSCEQFVLEARNGYRVKILGRLTMGALDYSNLRPYRLASGRTLFYATTRSTRLPDMQVDAAGIAPDILLPAPNDAAGRDAEVRRVQGWLEGGALQ